VLKIKRKDLAKLKGAAKRKFLARMAAGRRKAALGSKSAKKSTSKRNKSTKTNKPKRRSSSVAKKRKSGGKRSITSKIPLINNPTFKKVAAGVGTATIGVAILNLVAPQFANNAIVRPALAFLGGGIPGVIGQIVSQGGVQALGGIFGSSSTQNGNGGGGNAGFA